MCMWRRGWECQVPRWLTRSKRGKKVLSARASDLLALKGSPLKLHGRLLDWGHANRLHETGTQYRTSRLHL